MTKPLVSILMPVYNAGQYLRPSLQSILSQTYSNLEIIIIDDGSTDGCIDSIADIMDSRIKILKQQNSGRAGAMNHGLEKLSGDFYIAQDADDISCPDRVEILLKYLLDNPKTAAVFSGYNLILNGKIAAPRFAAKSREQCRQDIENFAMPAHGPTPMYRVSMVSNIRFEPALKVAEDIDYILKVGEKYPLAVLPKCLYSYRIHLNQSTRQNYTRNLLMIQKAVELACLRRGLNPKDHLPAIKTAESKRTHRQQETGIIPHFMESVLDLKRAGNLPLSLKTAIICMRLHPLDHYYYKPFCYFLTPEKLINFYRSIKNR